MSQFHNDPFAPEQPSSDANDILFGSSGFPPVPWAIDGRDLPTGTSYEGEITALSSTQQRSMQDKSKLETWPDGKPKMVALVTIRTSLRDPNRANDDGQRTLWVSGRWMTGAVRDAVRKAGANRLDVGGWLKVTLVDYGRPEGGFRAPRLFEAEYRKPTPAAAAANDALGMRQPDHPQHPQHPVHPQHPAPEPEPQPTPTPPTPAAQGQLDLSSLPADARALVEKMYTQQQAGGE